MLERTLVFVDTSYLLASFYNSWGEGVRGQLEISLATVVQRLDRVAREQVDQPVQRQLWYDGIPDSGPHRYQRTLRVIEGVQLRAGQLIEWGDRRTQKAVDTLLVADMIQAAHRGQCSDMVLVSGDADMIPGVRVAVEAGVRVHLVGFGWDSISSALRHSCDTSTVLDPRRDFEDAMQIRVLEGPLPPQVRTPGPRPAQPGDEGRHETDGGGVGMVEVDLRSERAAARSVAEEARLTVGDEERAADREEDDEVDEAPVEPAGAAAEGGAPGGSGPVEVVRDGVARDGAERDGGSRDGVAPDVPSAGFPMAGASPEAAAPPAEPVPDAASDTAPEAAAPSRPSPSMMAPHRRPLRSKYVPLSEEVWTSSGEQTPHDVGRQYATWWYEQAASEQQRDDAHLLSGGSLPPEIDRPLLQFACQMLGEFTLSESQRVRLRDGFHEGIRTVLLP